MWRTRPERGGTSWILSAPGAFGQNKHLEPQTAVLRARQVRNPALESLTSPEKPAMTLKYRLQTPPRAAAAPQASGNLAPLLPLGHQQTTLLQALQNAEVALLSPNGGCLEPGGRRLAAAAAACPRGGGGGGEGPSSAR